MKRMTFIFRTLLLGMFLQFLTFNVFSQIQISSSSLDLGAGYYGNYLKKQFSVKNTSTQNTYSVSFNWNSTLNGFSVFVNPTTGSLSPNQTMIVEVTATCPSQNAGIYSGFLSINFTKDGNTISDELTLNIIVEAPTGPNNFSSNNITENSCYLSWNLSANDIGYYVYKNGVKNTTPILYSNSSKTMTGLNYSTNYEFSVTRYNNGLTSSGAHAESNKSTINVRTLPKKPTISYSNVKPSSCVLSWASTGATRYDVYKNDVKITSTISTSITISNLCSDTQYNFYVKAYDNVKYSDKSNIVSPKTGKYAITGSNTICTANKTYSIANVPAGAIVTWTKSSNLTYVSGQGTSNYTIKAASSAVSGSGSISAVITNGSCTSAPVTYAVWVGKPSGAIIKPTNTNYMQVGEIRNYYLSPNPGNPTSYYWWVTGNPVGIEMLNNTNISNRNIEAIDPSRNTLYVQTTNACGTSMNFGRLIIVDGDLGGGGALKSANLSGEDNITDIGLINVKNLIVSPNPANESFEAIIENFDEADFLSKDKLQVTLYNSRSIAVYNGFSSENRFKINTSNYQNGIYYLQVLFKDQKYTTTVIISHN